ncbi:YjgN family protein [Hyphococcus sp.]|uniref:YjgN family protein n=1 Tax=Hyphococcus sp. TaxID=2038636 RepID=UPI003D1515B9
MTEMDFKAPQAQGDALAINNASRILPMLWIGFYTTLLNIVTLTLFRFWGRTHFRRRLWSDTTVGGEPLEYTGKGLELFIGFFIAIFTLMLPFAGILLAGQLFLGPELLAALLLPLYLVLFFVMGVAIFLARRYHLSRTRLRGIRFAQTGSATGYGAATLGYLLLTGITLGWYGPAARIRLSRKLWNGAWFGSEQFRFEDTPEAAKEPVYASFALAWVGSLVAYGLWAFWFFSTFGEIAVETGGAPGIEFILALYGSMIPLILVIGLFVCWHEAVMIRRIVKSLSVAGAKFSNRMSTFDILELTITNILLFVFTLGFGFMAVQMRVWKRIANRMELHGEVDFSAIEQTTQAAPKQGEGLADGLDIISNF